MLIQIVSILVDLITWLVIINVILSYFMSPYHPIREAVNRIVEPMLMPIRRYVPPIGGLDFSSFFLIILIQLIGGLLIGLMVNLG